MPSIDDFIAHRWADAREVLRGMDPEYVEVFERKTDVSAERQRVTHPIDATDKPRRSLPGEWHRILESCEQLSMQISPVEMAADGLHSVAAIGLDPIETGKRSDYHIRSWFVHMSALVERVQEVAGLTARLYVMDAQAAKGISDTWKSRVGEQIGKHVAVLRNDFVHPKRSWARNISPINCQADDTLYTVCHKLGNE